MLFVDGGHSYAAVRSDLDTFYPGLAAGGHVLLHDSYGGHPVQRAIHDFIADTDAGIIRSPYIPAAHWQTEHGSIAHLLKPPMHRAGQRAPRLDAPGRQEAITF